MMYELIKQEHDSGKNLRTVCQALDTTRTAYLHWVEHKDQKTGDEELLKQVHKIARDFPTYGYRRVTAELKRQKICVNRKKVLKTMKKHGLLAKQKKRFKPKTTDSEHNLHVYPNLIKNLEVTSLNQVWQADITYVTLLRGFVYLAVIIDRFSRKCVGWQLSRNIDAQLCLDALQKALRSRKKLGIEGLIHHSDRGVQYACSEYVALLEQQGIKPSMSAKGYAYDNAHAESFIKTVKYDEVRLNEYQDFNDAYQNIKKFIEEVYNRKRLHSAIGYKPPAEYEQEHLKKKRVA